MKIYSKAIIILLLFFLQLINSKHSIFSDQLLLSRSIKTDDSIVYEYKTEFIEVPVSKMKICNFLKIYFKNVIKN